MLRLRLDEPLGLHSDASWLDYRLELERSGDQYSCVRWAAVCVGQGGQWNRLCDNAEPDQDGPRLRREWRRQCGADLLNAGWNWNQLLPGAFWRGVLGSE